MRRHHHLAAWVLLSTSIALAGCDAGSPSAQSGDAAPAGRCKQTIAQGCAAGNLLFWGQGQNPCTTRPEQFAAKFEPYMYPAVCNLQYCGSKYTVVSLRLSQTDRDAWRYIYDAQTGALLEVEVLPWLGDGPYCLAGGTDALVTDSCTWGPSCNMGCALNQSECLPRTSVDAPLESHVCGPPTIMTGCDGSTTTFQGCSCRDSKWSCTTADGGTLNLTPSCDGGAD